MASEKELIKLEKTIKTKMVAIKNKTLLPKDSGIGKMLNLMKALDEPLYDKLLTEYKKILESI